MPQPAASRQTDLLRAWLLAEGLSPASAYRATGFEHGLALLQAVGAERPHPQLPTESTWLRVWSALPAGARDLLALRALAGVELARIAELQARPLARIEREWLLLGRRFAARDPAWPAALRAAFLALPLPQPAPRALQGLLATAALACFVAAAFADALHYRFVLDPAQQRLQAPPAAPAPVVEQVPLSAAEFELWADAVEFAHLEALDFLLWRLQAGGGEAVLADPPAPAAAPASAALPSPLDSPVLAPWAGLWPQLQPAQRAELQSRAQQWQGMSEAERQRFEQRADAYRALPPLARAELRERYARWRAFDAATRSTLRALEAGVQAAEPAQQQALRDQFLALPDAVRRGMLAGKTPELAELAREAFAFVPESEREPTLAMLRALGPQEHGLLRGMARRLDAAARDALRRELLAAEVASRPDLVRERAAAVGLRAPQAR